MMRFVTQKEFLDSLLPGDMGTLLADNFFATMQNWERIAVEKAPASCRASHSFIMKDQPDISEANGLFISAATVLKNVGDLTKVWIYRYTGGTPENREAIKIYCAAHEKKNLWHQIKDGDFYGVPGIFQFGINTVAHFFGKHYHIIDTPGEFCTEYAGKAILSVKWPYSNDPPCEITPSGQRYWFESEGAKFGWILAAQYDGMGHYLIA